MFKPMECKQRVQVRLADFKQMTQVVWDDVPAREYQSGSQDHIVIGGAGYPMELSVK